MNNELSRRGIISSGKLQEDFGKGEKLPTKTQGWNFILESRLVVLNPLYSEKRHLKYYTDGHSK